MTRSEERGELAIDMMVRLSKGEDVIRNHQDLSLMILQTLNRPLGLYLLEAELVSVLTETSTADHQPVFPDQSVGVPAVPAHSGVLPELAWVGEVEIWHPFLL